MLNEVGVSGDTEGVEIIEVDPPIAALAGDDKTATAGQIIHDVVIDGGSEATVEGDSNYA